MKIKNKFIKVISVLMSLTILVSTSVFARDTNFYEGHEFPNIDYSEMKYKKVDTTDYDKRIDEIYSLINQSGNHDEIMIALDICGKDLEYASTMYTSALIESNQDNSVENNQIRSEAMEIFISMQKRFQRLVKTISETEYITILTESLDEIELNEFLNDMPSDRYYELLAEEEGLLSKYYTEDDLEQQREIFIELVKCRNKIAKESGYDLYADFAYERLYKKDYNAADVEKYEEYVKQYIVPTYLKYKERYQNINIKPMEFESDEAVKIVKEHLPKISAELLDTFSYMEKYNLFDIDYSENKITPGTAFTADLGSFSSAYLFISPLQKEYGMNWTLGTLVHEFGHFNASMHRVAEGVYSDMGLDIAEVHSQGLEMLFMPFYDSIYKSEGATMSCYNAVIIMSSVITGCVYDEWQRAVYETPNLTLEQADDLYASIMNSYGGTPRVGEDKKEWATVPHNFDAPFYYISYSTSAMAALEIYAESIYDYNAAVDKYMNLTLAKDNESFRETLTRCGFGDVFDENTIKKVGENMGKAYFEFVDVKTDDWFYDAVMGVSGWMKGFENDEFRPMQNATRAEFVTAIGTMYEKMTGKELADEELPFTDIQDDDIKRFVAWAYKNGIVKGVEPDKFGGDETITREQLTAFVYRLAKSERYNTAAEESGFSDMESVSEYAVSAVEWACLNGIIAGYEDNSFKPQNSITRAETAQILRKFSKLLY